MLAEKMPAVRQISVSDFMHDPTRLNKEASEKFRRFRERVAEIKNRLTVIKKRLAAIKERTDADT